MVLQLTLSCDLDKTDSGPTLIHSTGVQHYKIPPEVIRILQDSLTNDLLSDHQEGVLCQDAPERILDILRQNGFTLQNHTNEDDKALWTVVQDGGSGDNEHPVHPNDPNPASNDEHAGDADGEDQGGHDEGENKEEENKEEEGGGGGEGDEEQQEEEQ